MLKKGYSLAFAILLFVLQGNARPPGDSVTTITIRAVGGLQYDLVRFKVKPGARVKIVFTNEDDMTHNLVFTTPGNRLEVVNAALRLGSTGVKLQYVPRLSQVLWFVGLLAPGETHSISFTAPKKPGVYPYVCTYPGHGFLMFGAMYVTDKPLPSIGKDQNIPERNREADSSGEKVHHQVHEKQRVAAEHPYENIPPYLYRTFMPDAGPAAIAVNLPGSLSYCWDAGTCSMRYAWEGNFIDNADVWKGHKDAYAKILGTVFFRSKTIYPLHFGEPGKVPVVQFKGYRLVNRYPEFHYLVDGMEVFELIQPAKDATGLVRTFRIPAAVKTTWFAAGSGEGVRYTASKGKWVNGNLQLSPGEAHEFTITMTKQPL